MGRRFEIEGLTSKGLKFTRNSRWGLTGGSPGSPDMEPKIVQESGRAQMRGSQWREKKCGPYNSGMGDGG